jgi:hypothetical protein
MKISNLFFSTIFAIRYRFLRGFKAFLYMFETEEKREERVSTRWVFGRVEFCYIALTHANVFGLLEIVILALLDIRIEVDKLVDFAVVTVLILGRERNAFADAVVGGAAVGGCCNHRCCRLGHIDLLLQDTGDSSTGLFGRSLLLFATLALLGRTVGFDAWAAFIEYIFNDRELFVCLQKK